MRTNVNWSERERKIRAKKYRRTSIEHMIYAVIFIGILLACITYPFFIVSSAENIIITPQSTAVKQKPGDKEQTYLIFATLENGTAETFESTDTILFGKFNSADVYFTLASNLNKKFSVKVAGWRVPFLSMNRNIINAELLEK